MVNRPPLSIVIRIPNVTLSQSDLETALGQPLDRCEQPTDRATGYAQIDIPNDRDQWVAALDWVRSVGDPIQRLVSESLIGSPRLDVAVVFPSSVISTSVAIPAPLAAAAGKAGLDIDISIYLTSDPPPEARPLPGMNQNLPSNEMANMTIDQVDAEIRLWAEKHLLDVSRRIRGQEVWNVYLSSIAGECFQIWIEPTSEGKIGVHADYVEGPKHPEPTQEWTIDDSKLPNGLEEAYHTVLKWMAPSSRYFPPVGAARFV